jgi:predicted alpha/beta-hydrolase family hydrolase
VGLLFLGYPLHRAGDEDTLRDAPLKEIEAPMLFFTGSKDRMCRVELIEQVLRQVPAKTEHRVVEDGDHSLDLPKRDPVRRDEVHTYILDETTDWLRTILKKPKKRR